MSGKIDFMLKGAASTTNLTVPADSSSQGISDKALCITAVTSLREQSIIVATIIPNRCKKTAVGSMTTERNMAMGGNRARGQNTTGISEHRRIDSRPEAYACIATRRGCDARERHVARDRHASADISAPCALLGTATARTDLFGFRFDERRQKHVVDKLLGEGLVMVNKQRVILEPSISAVWAEAGHLFGERTVQPYEGQFSRWDASSCRGFYYLRPPVMPPTSPEPGATIWEIELLLKSLYAELHDAASPTKDFEECVASVERILQLLEQQGENIDNSQTELCIEKRLPRWALLEVEQAKEADAAWSVRKLRDKLQVIVRIRENMRTAAIGKLTHEGRQAQRQERLTALANYAFVSSVSEKVIIKTIVHEMSPLPLQSARDILRHFVKRGIDATGKEENPIGETHTQTIRTVRLLRHPNSKSETKRPVDFLRPQAIIAIQEPSPEHDKGPQHTADRRDKLLGLWKTTISSLERSGKFGPMTT
uniref:Uncharacterized protein n=1 Tax=Parascaris univalens TaxID=6257 RepID=A0A915AZU5_PARUN